MRKPRSVLVLLLLLVFGVSLAVTAEDVPETPYDESETLPYESTPTLSNEVLQESGRALPPTPIFASSFDTGFMTRRAEILAERSERSAHAISDSLIVLDHSFRC
jgi:hypothetical protein